MTLCCWAWILFISNSFRDIKDCCEIQSILFLWRDTIRTVWGCNLFHSLGWSLVFRPSKHLKYVVNIPSKTRGRIFVKLIYFHLLEYYSGECQTKSFCSYHVLLPFQVYSPSWRNLFLFLLWNEINEMSKNSDTATFELKKIWIWSAVKIW